MAKLYGAVEEQDFSHYTGTVQSGGAGNIRSFNQNMFKSQMESFTAGATLYDSGALTQIRVTYSGGGYSIYVYDNDWHNVAAAVVPSDMSYWGISVKIADMTVGDDYVNLTPAYSPSGTFLSKQIIKLYGTDLSTSLTRRINKLYGPVSEQDVIGVTGTIDAGGAGNVTAFDGDVFWLSASSLLSSTNVNFMRIPCDGTDSYSIVMYYTGGGAGDTIVSGTAADLANYGISISGQTFGNDFITLAKIMGTVYKTKLIYEDSSV